MCDRRISNLGSRLATTEWQLQQPLSSTSDRGWPIHAFLSLSRSRPALRSATITITCSKCDESPTASAEPDRETSSSSREVQKANFARYVSRQISNDGQDDFAFVYQDLLIRTTAIPTATISKNPRIENSTLPALDATGRERQRRSRLRRSK